MQLCSKSLVDSPSFLNAALKIMTPEVTAALPPSFHNLTTQEKIRDCFRSLLNEASVYRVDNDKNLIGFIFISQQHFSQDHVSQEQYEGEVIGHIGYLLGEAYWRKGFAFEMLTALIAQLKQQQGFHHLKAGVAIDNLGSVMLLEKLGFKRQSETQLGMLSYRLELN